MGRTNGIDRPMVGLAVRDKGTDADDCVVDVLWKFVANRLADLRIGFADKIVGGRKPAEVGHSLQVPDDDAWFHTNQNVTYAGSLRKLLCRVRRHFDEAR